MRTLKDTDQLVLYDIACLKEDLESFGGEHLANDDGAIRELVQRIERQVTKSDLYDRINEAISEFVDEMKRESEGEQSNRDHDNEAYNWMKDKEARGFK